MVKNTSVWISNGNITFSLPKWILNSYEKFKIYVAVYCPFSLLFLFHKMKEAGGGEASLLAKNEVLFQIFPWCFWMENNFFWIYPKYSCLFYHLLNILFLFVFISINLDFFSEVLLLFKHPIIFKLILDCLFNSDGRVK